MKDPKLNKQHKFILTTFFTFILLGSGIAQSPGDIVVAEIMADPASGAGLSEPGNEYFVLCNRSGTGRNLNGFTVTDNGSSVIDLPDYFLHARACAVVANSAINLTSSGYDCATMPTNIILSNVWFSNNLANSSDRIGFLSPTSLLIDGVSYGSDMTFLSPSAADVFDNTSTTLIRAGYGTIPVTSLPDSDSGIDWTSRSGTPCDAPLAPTAANVSIRGRARSQSGNGLKFVVVMLAGGSLSEAIYSTSNQFGHYSFEDVPVGGIYVVQAMSGRHTFKNPSRVINPDGDLVGIDFIGEAIDSSGRDSKKP